MLSLFLTPLKVSWLAFMPFCLPVVPLSAQALQPGDLFCAWLAESWRGYRVLKGSFQRPRSAERFNGVGHRLADDCPLLPSQGVRTRSFLSQSVVCILQGARRVLFHAASALTDAEMLSVSAQGFHWASAMRQIKMLRGGWRAVK